MDNKYRNPIIHDTGKSSYPGDYELTEKSLSKDYYDIDRNLFGSTEVILSEDTSFRVKDYQYRLPSGEIGMRFIPINDFGDVVSSNSQPMGGSTLIDNFLREEMGLSAKDEIYAFVNYFHPEQNKGTIIDLLTGAGSDKIELGFTHLGAYWGRGYTTNAPMLYHGHKFGVTGEANGTLFGYPANVQILSMDGVAQNILNKNLKYVDTCLNSGVMFPNESPEAYKDSKFRISDINTALMFYRDWIKFEGYLRTDDTWYTYCAAHKTVVATIALNLPHNLASFQEVYGKEEGADLFAKFKLFYNNIIGPDPGFLDSDETDFEPLWKKHGLTAEQISPFTMEEYKAYEQAWLNGKLNHFKGKQPVPASKGMPWAPQNTAEIVYDIVRTYADMLDCGSVVSSSIILGFMEQVDDRMGISKINYLWHAMPIVEKLMIADAQTKAAANPDTYLKSTFNELYVAFGGSPDKPVDYESEQKKLHGFSGLMDIIKGFVSKKLLPEAIAAWALLGVVKNWENIIAPGTIPVEDAYVQMMDAIQKDLESAEELVISSPDKVQYNTPPAITHSIANGLYSANDHVSIREVCTVIDISESQLKST